MFRESLLLSPKQRSIFLRVKNIRKSLQDLEIKITNLSKTFAEKKELSATQLEKWKAGISHDLDAILRDFDAKKNTLREAISQKEFLQKFRESIPKTVFPVQFRLLLGAPIIYSMIFPALLLDLFLLLYQGIFFWLVRIPRVRRKDHFCYDRRHLSYLNGLEKLNCLYCSYFNGLMSFAREIAGRTERYFCPIKNAQRRHDPHTQYDVFFEYLDGENYRKKHQDLRDFSKKKEG